MTRRECCRFWSGSTAGPTPSQLSPHLLHRRASPYAYLLRQSHPRFPNTHFQGWRSLIPSRRSWSSTREFVAQSHQSTDAIPKLWNDETRAQPNPKFKRDHCRTSRPKPACNPKFRPYPTATVKFLSLSESRHGIQNPVVGFVVYVPIERYVSSSAPLRAKPQISMAEDKIGENPHLDEIPSTGPFVINQTRTSFDHQPALQRHSFFPFEILSQVDSGIIYISDAVKWFPFPSFLPSPTAFHSILSSRTSCTSLRPSLSKPLVDVSEQ